MSKSWRDALKRTSAAGPAAAGVKKPTTNPFELKFNKQKFDIMNKTKPGMSVGKPGASRKKAEELRKKTLLKEYKNVGNTSRVIDRRLGKDADDDDEAALTRFAKARSRKESERQRYQLSDDDEDLALTHKGQALSTKNMNDFIDSDLDADQPDMDNFGGFKEQGGEGKTRAEVMKELISKSKYYKLERQRIKEENEAMRGDLDAKFEVVRKGLLREENRRRGKEDEDNASAAPDNDFDSAVRQLSFEKRLAAQNEVKKTPEELEKMQLEKEFRKQQELKKRIAGENEEEANEEELQLSRRMQAAEKELYEVVDRLCKCDNIADMEALYTQIVTGFASSSHRQVLLAKVCRDRMSKIYKQFTARVLDDKAVINKPGAIVLLLLIGRVFSTCDFHHIVSTPAHLTGVYLLHYGKIGKVRHAVHALWLCQILLDYQTLSKRYIPEVMNTLYSLALHCFEKQAPADTYYLVKPLKFKFVGEADFSIENILQRPDQISADSFKKALLDTILKASKLYRELSCHTELFAPFKECGAFEAETDTTIERQPMALHDHKPIPLPQLEPFIEDDIVADRKRRVKRDDNPQREIQRLKAAHKKEMRSAARELRKDAAFLAREQLSEKKAKDAEYKARINRLYGSLGNEGAEK